MAEGAGDPKQPRGEDQWISMELVNNMRINDMTVRNAHLDYGKFYKGSKDEEISASEVNTTIIPPSEMEPINACGRQASPTGTEGYIDIYVGNTKICRLYWDCPFWSSSNKFEVRDYDPVTSNYTVTTSAWNPGPGPIGRVTVTITSKG